MTMVISEDKDALTELPVLKNAAKNQQIRSYISDYEHLHKRQSLLVYYQHERLDGVGGHHIALIITLSEGNLLCTI